MWFLQLPAAVRNGETARRVSDAVHKQKDNGLTLMDPIVNPVAKLNRHIQRS